MTAQDQSTDFLRQSQTLWTNAIGSWARIMQRMLSQAGGGSGPFDLNRAVDAWFDLLGSLLAVNREAAKNIARATFAAASTIGEQAERAGGAARQQAGSASRSWKGTVT